MSRPSQIILGIDTSLRSTGVGVVEGSGQILRLRHFGRIRNAATLRHTECLDNLYRGISEVIAAHAPKSAAVEGIFHHKNAGTAMILGQARGVVLAACARAGVPVYEYAPRSVKQAVVGTGTAHKDHVAKMITALLGLAEPPPEDAADALAIAIAHLHHVTGHRLTDPTEI